MTNTTVNVPDFGKICDPSDPRMILTVKSSNKKAIHITQFLTEVTRKKRQGRRRDLVLSKSEDDSLVLRQDEDHPYSGITISEWSGANCRLMAFLLRTGELSINMIEYYLAYTTQIYDFVSKYEWNSILQFDYQYRERQAEHGFTRGSLTANMELQLLQQRIPRSSDGGSNTGNVYKSHKDRSENLRRPSQPCRLYKARNGNCP